MDYEILSHNIKKYRKVLGLTQKQLGEQIFKSEISVRKYESGNVNVPTSTLSKISEVFGIPIAQLLYIPVTEEDLEQFKKDSTINSNVIDFSQVSTKQLIEELNRRSDFPIKIDLK